RAVDADRVELLVAVHHDRVDAAAQVLPEPPEVRRARKAPGHFDDRDVVARVAREIVQHPYAPPSRSWRTPRRRPRAWRSASARSVDGASDISSSPPASWRASDATAGQRTRSTP